MPFHCYVTRPGGEPLVIRELMVSAKPTAPVP